MIRWIFVFLSFPVVVFAASPSDLKRLHSILSTNELMAILSEEGLEQSEDLRETMLNGRGGMGWSTTIERIYAPERLDQLFRTAFDEALANSDVSPLLEFYEGATGARIAKLEVEARRAIMSDDVEDAARAAYNEVSGSGSNREDLLEQFADLNDLVDRNVAGALNANLAFFRGLGSEDSFEMTEDQMLRQVYSQEAEIREDTTGWIYGYMTFAYESLSDDQLQEYVDMTGSDAGRDLNRALFAGFDAVFLDVSYALGRATARFSIGDEL